MKKKAQKELRKQHAAAEAAANIAVEHAEMKKALHSDAILQHIADGSKE